MKTYWFSQKEPEEGQLIAFTWQGDAQSRTSDDPRPGPYIARGRYCKEHNLVVLRSLEVMTVEAAFAWHPLAEDVKFTAANIQLNGEMP